jgi:hypothetical protein
MTRWMMVLLAALITAGRLADSHVAIACRTGDPFEIPTMYASRIVPWLMNEGSFILSIKLAAQKIEFS